MKIEARNRDLGGFTVRRVLPFAKRRMVGPFIFLDHMGPMKLDETHAMDVRPHPHIGLATFTYLYEGRGFHRDSLGNARVLLPNEVNWMIAGSGIAHSERSPETERLPGHALHGIQIWVALPKSHETMAPEFHHHGADELPEFTFGEAESQAKMKLLIGEYGEKRSPVKTMMRTLAMDLQFSANSQMMLSLNEKEIGIYVAQGEVAVHGEKISEGTMLVLESPTDLFIESGKGARLMLVGGDPYPEPRHIWWNFVASDVQKIREAAARWSADEFAKVPGESEKIPLPTDPLP